MVPDAYIICGTPRTGSTLLCRLLKSAGAGDPDSFFGRRFIPEWAEHWGVPSAESMAPQDFASAYLDAAIRVGKGGTEIFGLRLMRENVVDLDGFVDLVHPGLAPGRARFEKAFGAIRYIHLFREDKLAQAVSLVKAEQTGLWHVAPDGTELERLAPPQDPVYDFDRLRREVEELESYDAAWWTWFNEQGVTPLRVGYETLSADPATTLIGICEALEIAAPDASDIKPSVAKLSDAISNDWMRRYRDDMLAAG
jgi:LPS sulfotransferase NodH